MKELDAASTPKLARKARLRHDRHTGTSMIVYPERGLALNASAAAIAAKLDGTRTVRAIAEELAGEHGGDVETIERDVLAFVRELAARALVER